jgi:hypothetical protein
VLHAQVVLRGCEVGGAWPPMRALSDAALQALQPGSGVAELHSSGVTCARRRCWLAPVGTKEVRPLASMGASLHLSLGWPNEGWCLKGGCQVVTVFTVYRTSSQPRPAPLSPAATAPKQAVSDFATFFKVLETLHRVFHGHMQADFKLTLSFC